jgi:NADH-quinone oxidoreductase subunit K
VITVQHYLVLSFFLFMCGVAGVLLRRNILVVLMSIELMLNAANIALVAFSRQLGDDRGQGLALLVIAIAAAEAAVGLALVIAMFRHKRTVQIDEFNSLQG